MAGSLTCTATPALISIPSLVSLTETDALLGFIDPVSNMEQSRVFLLSGTRDTVIGQGEGLREQ